MFNIESIKSFGDFTVYRRFHTDMGSPRYFVLRESDNRILEEFRQLRSAMKWARTEAAL